MTMTKASLLLALLSAAAPRSAGAQPPDLASAQSVLRSILRGGPAPDGIAVPPVVGGQIRAAAAKKADDFSLQDLKGQAHSLAKYKGKYVLLDFTTTWCGVCKQATPLINGHHAELKDKGLVILAAYDSEAKQTVQDYVDAHKVAYTALLDSDGAVRRQYRVRGYPTFVLVDPEGNVVYQGAGLGGLQAAIAKFKATLK